MEGRLLGVSYNTYKKYVRKYGIFEDLRDTDGTGIKKVIILREENIH